MSVPRVRIGVEGGSLQERFERTRAGRAIISVFILATLVTLLTANLPGVAPPARAPAGGSPYLYGLGLDQQWGVFAPDPRQETVDVFARVTFADGSLGTWRVPTRGPVVGEYVDYRWLKWDEYVVQPGTVDLWKPVALYVARQYATPRAPPGAVNLTNRAPSRCRRRADPPARAHQRADLLHGQDHRRDAAEGARMKPARARRRGVEPVLVRARLDIDPGGLPDRVRPDRASSGRSRSCPTLTPFFTKDGILPNQPHYAGDARRLGAARDLPEQDGRR